MSRSFVLGVLTTALVLGFAGGAVTGVIGRDDEEEPLPVAAGPVTVAPAAVPASRTTAPPTSTAASTTPAPQPTPTGDGLARNEIFVVVNAAGGTLALDVSGAATHPDADVIAYPRHGQPNQQWLLSDAGEGWVRLRAAHSGLCLAVGGDGVHVQQRDCAVPGARWRPVPAGQAFALTSEAGPVLALGEQQGQQFRVVVADPMAAGPAGAWLFQQA